jgi:hypothetical protein
MIGQTMINIHAGSKLRFSGIVAAVVLLVIVLALPPLIEVIPLGALVGVMAMVVIHTFEWRSFSLIFILPIADTCIVIVVTALAFFTNLAYAVMAGIFLQAIVFSWSNSGRIKRTQRTVSASPDGSDATVAYTIEGPLFFASVGHFKKIFLELRGEPENVVIHLENVRVYDSSGLMALNDIAAKLTALKKHAVIYMSPSMRESLDPSAEVLRSITFVTTVPRALKFPYALPETGGWKERVEPHLRKFRETYCFAYTCSTKAIFKWLCHAPQSLRQKCCYAVWRFLCCAPCLWDRCDSDNVMYRIWRMLCWNVWIEPSCGPPAAIDEDHPVLALDADGEWIGAEIAGSDIWECGREVHRQHPESAYVSISSGEKESVSEELRRSATQKKEEEQKKDALIELTHEAVNQPVVDRALDG